MSERKGARPNARRKSDPEPDRKNPGRTSPATSRAVFKPAAGRLGCLPQLPFPDRMGYC